MGASSLAINKSARSRRTRKWPWALLIIALILLGLVIVFRTTINGYAGAGTAYSARVACSCRFVAGRSLEDCEKDKLSGMELISLSADEEAKSVTARFPLIRSDTATYRKGYGCVLEEWHD